MGTEHEHRAPDSGLKGTHVQKTDAGVCICCALCLSVCDYGARSEDGDIMLLNTQLCIGCSACVYACPEDAIRMVPRDA